MRTHKITTILMLLVACITAGNTYAQTLVDRVAIIVNDESILQSEVQDRLNQLEAQIESQGAQLPPASVLMPQLLERIVVDSIQDQMADRYQIKVSDADVNEAMSRIASRQNMTFQQYVAELQKTSNPAAIREQIRQELKHYQLQQRVLASRVQVSQQEVQDFLNSKEALENQNIEYKLRHILLQLNERATPEEVAEKKEQALALIDSIKKGENSFEQAAISVSNDGFALKGGDMGWRRISQIPSRLTKPLLKLKQGQISQPVRSPSGFHILYLEDKRGEEKVMVERAKIEHILIKPNQIRSDEQAEQFAIDLKNSIQEGKTLADLARTFSDDPGSALNGGDLGWVTLESLDPTFADVARQVKLNTISDVFRSQFGYHILRVTDRREEDMSDTLKANRAQRWLQQREFEDYLPVWLSEIRGEAFVEFKPPFDQYIKE